MQPNAIAAASDATSAATAPAAQQPQRKLRIELVPI
jgi:hypothetical protein